MARFGRGQPHAPIFLRAPLVAAMAAATGSPIHVTLAESHRPPPSHVLYLRPSRGAVVPDRLAPQFHIIQAPRHKGFAGDVLVVRNPQAPAVVTPPARQPLVLLAERRRPVSNTPVIFARSYTVDAVADAGKATPQIHIVSLTPYKASRRPDSVFLYVRPSRTSLVPDRLPVQIHVLQQTRRRADGASLVVVLRNPLVPTVIPDRIPQQIHVVSPTVARRAVKPDGLALYLRPSRASLVPDRLPPQIHIISRVGSRLRVVREPMLLFLHGGPPAIPVITMPLQLEDRSGFRYGVLDQGTKRYLVIEASGMRYVVEEDSAPKQEVKDQSHSKLDSEDTA